MAGFWEIPAESLAILQNAGYTGYTPDTNESAQARIDAYRAENMPQAPMASGGGSSSGGGSNPYLSGAADEMARRSNTGLQQAFNGIRSNAVGVGGMGGSRQGVAEAVATGMANDALTGNIGNLFATDWTNQQNRDLQNRGLDVTMRGQDIGWQNANRQLDNQGRLLDSQLETAGINNAWAPIINAGNVFSQFGGGSQTNSTNTGGGWGGALGGLLGGTAVGTKAGWW